MADMTKQEIKQYREDRKKQLLSWLEGKSIHYGTKKEGDCCPDFSCCMPELLAPKEERELFIEAYLSDNYKVYENMLMMFLGRGLPLMTDKKVYISGKHEIED
jgi:hypothetical protein